MIERCWEELSNFGEIQQRASMARYESRPGIWQERTVDEYLLNRDQVLYLITRSYTKKAREVTVRFIKIYGELERRYRQGQQVLIALSKRVCDLEAAFLQSDKRQQLLEGIVVQHESTIKLLVDRQTVAVTAN